MPSCPPSWNGRVALSPKGGDFHFTVTLGVDLAATQTPVLRPPEELNQLRVLIIDDNPMAREILLGMLTSMGWQAEVAGSGEQGLACIEARAAAGQPPFQAVLVDWNMPGMDGWETCLRIRHATAGNSAPIMLMVTAHGRELLAQQNRPRRLHGMRVLVVEDNKTNQQVAQELLSREGAQVTLAENGQLGVQAVLQAQPPFDVVLMDVQMSELLALADAELYRAKAQGRGCVRGARLPKPT